MLLLFNFSYSQQYKFSGVILDENGNSVPYVNLLDSISLSGTSANFEGNFELFLAKGFYVFKLSSVGFSDKLINVELNSDTNFVFKLIRAEDFLEEVVISGTLSEISKRESPIPIEVYSANYLNKVPVPGLLEATQNINGVRPQLNCAVCNTGDIHINGMEGPYTMVTIDGMPIVGGLSSVYGLQGIPNSLLQRVEVVKGPASTLYGSEAVAGLINVITKDVECAPKISFNISSTSWREIQTDLMFKYAENKKISGVFAADYHNYSKPIDNNGDNFTDLTLKDRISIFNKWSVNRKDKKKSIFSARYLYEDRWGGEMQWNNSFRAGDSIYGESIFTNRVELIGKHELPVNEDVVLSGSFSYHGHDSRYGLVKYVANQQIAFGQLVWNKKIGKSHNLVNGLAVRYSFYDDNTPVTSAFENGIQKNEPNKWLLPGLFCQDNVTLSKKMNILLGSRLDYHSIHGLIFSPRLNWKWSPSSYVFRFGYGNGFRVVNVFSEDHAALTGARDVIVSEGLNPEKSNNLNLNIEKTIFTPWTKISLDASLFYTYFSNKIIPNYSNDSQISYSNLNGYGVSRGISLNAKFIFNIPLRINLGTTLLDVYSMQLNEEANLIKENQLFTEPYSCTWSCSYDFKRVGMTIDYTGNLYGPMHLPIVENDFRLPQSSPFSIMNIKIAKDFDKGFNVYAGIRNLLNYTPPANSILRAHDPFDKYVDDELDNPNNYSFDPSYIYTSFQGITFFGGIKYVFN
ncbi:MAG: TonB-dependent receptor [Flavobacteriales bacterium]|nr:TonB-dependent receptor [Flavobacteriales bacterium]